MLARTLEVDEASTGISQLDIEFVFHSTFFFSLSNYVSPGHLLNQVP
jgi:hypothetical protein